MTSQRPIGRVQITGTVVWVGDEPGHIGGTLHRIMRVNSDEGWSVRGSVPASLWGSITVGQRVQFVATIGPSGWFKRPIVH